MPFHIFLSQSLSLLTGGLSAWKIAKDAITALILAIVVILVLIKAKPSKQKHFFYLILLLSAVYLLMHLILWAFSPDIYRQSATLGAIYNNRLLWYLMIGMGLALFAPSYLSQHRAVRLALIVSSAVCVLGILQYFLPKDILTNFGYSLARGVHPAFFIDDKPDLPRIMSTLRDPNSLGAFLILPITLLGYKLIRSQRKLLIGGLLGLHGLALFLTFSRSAWLGVVISLSVLGFYELRGYIGKLFKYWPLLLAVVILLGGLVFLLRDQYVVQNVLIHSDENTTAQLDSNEYHLVLIQRGLQGIKDRPLGHGPGTSGLVSIQNPQGGVLTENYYVQIAYEVGILGLLLFVGINILIYKKLSRQKPPLAICLLASFWGYILVNMLLHTWSNEAVAAQWWLLAGLAIGVRHHNPKQV